MKNEMIVNLEKNVKIVEIVKYKAKLIEQQTLWATDWVI